MEKLPSISVIVPIVVPFTAMFAPGIGSPFASTTRPLILPVVCSIPLIGYVSACVFEMTIRDLKKLIITQL